MKRINRLNSDFLYPGQVIKVPRRTDPTMNKDVDEEVKLSPKAKATSPIGPDSTILRNSEGEISNLGAIQTYLSGISSLSLLSIIERYKTIVELHDKYSKGPKTAAKTEEKDDAEFVFVGVPQDMEEENKKIKDKHKKEEVISHELSKLGNMEESYELQCEIMLSDLQKKVKGVLEISQYFVSFEPIDDPSNEFLVSEVCVLAKNRIARHVLCKLFAEYRFVPDPEGELLFRTNEF